MHDQTRRRKRLSRFTVNNESHFKKRSIPMSFSIAIRNSEASTGMTSRSTYKRACIVSAVYNMSIPYFSAVIYCLTSLCFVIIVISE